MGLGESRMRAPAPRSLKARALMALAQREQSRAELRRKLLVHARAEDAASCDAAAAAAAEAEAEAPATIDALTPEQRVDAVLDWLESHRYLSDDRFAEARVHARMSKFGNVRIRQELKSHRVALAPNAAESLAASEAARAAAVLERRFPQAPASAAERARQSRFLAARGFSSTSIQWALRARASHRTAALAESEPGAADDGAV